MFFSTVDDFKKPEIENKQANKQTKNYVLFCFVLFQFAYTKIFLKVSYMEMI